MTKKGMIPAKDMRTTSTTTAKVTTNMDTMIGTNGWTMIEMTGTMATRIIEKIVLPAAGLGHGTESSGYQEGQANRLPFFIGFTTSFDTENPE